jgi:hypothetical protein
MKAKLALLIAGVVLGSTGMATASGWWQHSTPAYVCSGPSTIVKCTQRGTGYSIFVSKGLVSIAYTGRALFACRRHYPEDCGDLR